VRPNLVRLEDRTNPAYTWNTTAAGALTITAAPGDVNALTVSWDSTLNLYTFADATQVFNVGTDAAGALVSGNGTKTLVLSGAKLSTLAANLGDQTDTATVTTTLGAPLSIDGGGNGDTLVGLDAANTWNITGADAGNFTGAGKPVTFTTFANLTGGAGNDTFAFADKATVSGKIDGGGGTNALDYSAYTTGVKVNLGANAPSLIGTVGGDQEVPPTGSAATGTVTVSNFDPATNKFDIAVQVNNFDPTQVTGFHLHRAVVGVSGPIDVDLKAAGGTLVPSGTGFTLNMTGVQLPAIDQAAFQGGGMYFNFHSNANPTGEARAQLFQAAPAVAVNGVATGTGGIANIQNVTGSAANDSLIGNAGANVINGGPGDDTIIGAQGNDTLSGGDGNDLIVWNNGDGSDTIDGNAGTNTVQVNGSVDKGDAFLVAAAGARVNFQRTNLTPFALDIGTTQTLIVNGAGGDDTFTVGDLTGVATLTALNLNGLDGNDTFTGPNLPTTYTITGANRGTAASGPVAISFATTENLTGGTGNDTFAFADKATLSGKLDGGGGTNTLDYSAYTTGVSVNLGADPAGLTGTFGLDPAAGLLTTTATGTATVINYNPATHKFDLTIATQNFDPATLGKIQLRMYQPNSPATTVDLTGLGTPTASGTGFTFTATGVTLPAGSVNEAAFVGGLDSILITSTTQANGFVSAPLFPSGAFAADTANARATGTGGIANIANVTGGSGDDGLVGNLNANVISGGPGNDILVGAGGGDTVSGGDGNDTLVWNEGDGSEKLDGDAGADTVVVNGSQTKANILSVAPGAIPSRVSVQRMGTADVSAFALDVGTSEILNLNGGAANDLFTVNSLAGVSNLQSVTLTGGAGNDTFTVTQTPGVTITASGGLPVPPATPGDTLTLTPGGATAVGSNTAAGQGGRLGSASTGVVTFSGMETLNGITLVSNTVATSPFLVGPDAGMGPTVQLYDLTGKASGSVSTVFASNFTGGVRVAVADVNGDGVPDEIVGTGPGVATNVRVISGKDGSQILAIAPFESTFTGGVFVTAADLDGDGKAEIIITPDQGGGPRVRIFSGAAAATGVATPIADFFGIADPNFRGGARAAVGDVNGDGTPDLVVAAGFGGGPRVAVFDGKTLASGNPVRLFNDFFVFEQTLRNGVYVTAGDMNGDGFADIIAGGGPGGGPRVFAISGKDMLSSNGVTQTVLANFFAGDSTLRGGVRLATRDIDGDGKADIITGDGTGDGSTVRAYASTLFPATSATPTPTFQFDAFPGFTGGVFVG
jgi:Ca2+-binding RTX toxin-like protein